MKIRAQAKSYEVVIQPGQRKEIIVNRDRVFSVTAQEGLCLVRRRRDNQGDIGNVVSSCDGFKMNCQKGDIFIFEVLHNGITFVGRITQE